VRAIQAFHDEIVRAVALGADYLVVHPGSCCGKAPERGNTPAQAIRDVAQGIRQAARGVRLCAAFGDLRDCGLRLLLENTSGMGMAIGSRFEELEAILDGAPELPLGVCLDTAHAFHAGYDIRSEAGLAQTIAELERTVSLSRVAVLHVNDSKTPFASRVDRHEHIGRGHIGLEAFRRLLNHPSLSSGAAGGRPGRAFLLETPIDAPGDDRRNVRRLWDLVGIAVKQAPRAQNGFSMLTRTRRNATPSQRNRRRPKPSRKPTIRSGSSSRPPAKVTNRMSFRRLKKSNRSEGPLGSSPRIKESRRHKG
jgi:apurinic endonuclease APN1